MTTKHSNDQAIERAGRDGIVCEEDCDEVDREPTCCLRETRNSVVKRRMAIIVVLMCAVCGLFGIRGRDYKIPKSGEKNSSDEKGVFSVLWARVFVMR